MNFEKKHICFAIAIVIFVLLLICPCRKSPSEHLTIREANRPGTVWKTQVYTDPSTGLTIDDAYAGLIGKEPAISVIMFHRLNCSEFAPMAKVFRTARRNMENTQVRFYEEVADPLNPLDYGSYPMVIKRWRDGLDGSLQIAKYEGSFDFGEFQDWVLSDKIERMPTEWVKAWSGEVHTSREDIWPAGPTPADPYPTTLLDPSGRSHNFM